MMAYIWMFIVGLAAGYIARMLHPGKDNIGMILTGVLGVAGSFLANYLGQAVGWYKAGENAGFIASVIGAVVLLVIYGFVAKKADGGANTSSGGGTST
jgi:uncharacterized membrane protein YeaQ/YmgE (transglycosylase-associated protein family)